MGAPFSLTLLSEDGYQVFAALHREFDTLEQAIAGAREDYRSRYGGQAAFRVYHAEPDGSGYRHVLIEACFDETKRRSFVALYKILQEVRAEAPRPSIRSGVRLPALAGMLAWLGFPTRPGRDPGRRAPAPGALIGLR